MTMHPQPARPDSLPDVVDLDALLADSPALVTPHDWAAPDLFPDDEEFDDFLASVRTERDKGLS